MFLSFCGKACTLCFQYCWTEIDVLPDGSTVNICSILQKNLLPFTSPLWEVFQIYSILKTKTLDKNFFVDINFERVFDNLKPSKQ